MASLPQCFYRGKAPADTAPKIVTVPADQTYIVTNVVATNGTTAQATFSFYIDGVPVAHQSVIPAGGIFTLDCAQVVEASRGMSFSSSVANAIGVHVSGVGMVGA